MQEEQLIRLLLSERPKVLGFIVSLVRRVDLAEDIYQDVCVLALAKRQEISSEAHLLNWLRTASRLQSLNALRKRGKRELSLSDETLAILDSQWQSEDATDSSAMLEALRNCLDLLPQRAVDLVRKRYVLEVPYAELAAQLQRPVASLYVTFARIHAALADCVSQRLAAGGSR